MKNIFLYALLMTNSLCFGTFYDMTRGVVDLTDEEICNRLFNLPITVFVSGTTLGIPGGITYETTRPNGLGFACDMRAPFINIQTPIELPLGCNVQKFFEMIEVGEVLDEADELVNGKDNNRRFYFKNYFAHGWDGQLNRTVRLDEARKLYAQLGRVAAIFQKKFNYKPKITIVTFSHGGNIALGMALIKTEFGVQDLFTCDLVLNACPVQEVLRECPGDTLYDRAYSLYSRSDTVQVLDPQGVFVALEDGAFLSQRFYFLAFNNLAQVEVLPNVNVIDHEDTIRPANLGFVPKILQLVDNVRATTGQQSILARADITYGNVNRTKLTLLPTTVCQR